MKKIILFIFLGLLSNSLFAAEVKEWVGKSWISGQNLYFSGISELSDSLKKAKELAYNDAVSNAAKYLGIKVSNQTDSKIKNNDITLTDKTSTLLEDTFISYAVIKDFYFEEKNNKYIAYILLEIDKDVLAKEQKRKDDIKQEKKEEIKKEYILIEENKKSGEYKLIIPKQLNNIKYDIQNLFQNAGYVITNKFTKDEDIKKIQVKVIDEQVNNVIDDMFSYEIKISVKFNNKSFILNSKKISEDNVNMAKKLVCNDILKQLKEKLKNK